MAEATSKAVDAETTLYDKGNDREEVDLQVAGQRVAGWCEARAKAGRIHSASRTLKRCDGCAGDSARV